MEPEHYMWYDVKCGVMGYIPQFKKWILFPTEDEYKNYIRESIKFYDELMDQGKNP